MATLECVDWFTGDSFPPLATSPRPKPTTTHNNTI